MADILEILLGQGGGAGPIIIALAGFIVHRLVKTLDATAETLKAVVKQVTAHGIEIENLKGMKL